MGARILVVDDSVTIQKVIELTFSKEGFDLVQARNGAEGIQKARETRPDLVLLDILMPDMSGYEVCAALRAEPGLRDVPVILLTGTFEAFDQTQADAVGATDFVTKPFESQSLIGKVKQHLFARGAGTGPGRPVPPPPAVAELSLETAPEPAGRPSELVAPTLEISQDQLWQLLEAPAAPEPPPGAGAGKPAEFHLEEFHLEEPAPPSAPAGALDLDLLGDEPPIGGPESDPEISPLPESLSLDDLLAEVPEPPAPAVVEAAGDAAVFDLSAEEEAAPLPMVEAAAAGPPGLSVEDLLEGSEIPPSEEGDPAGPALELPELDLLGGGLLPETLAPPPPALDQASPEGPGVSPEAPPDAEPESLGLEAVLAEPVPAISPPAPPEPLDLAEFLAEPAPPAASVPPPAVDAAEPEALDLPPAAPTPGSWEDPEPPPPASSRPGALELEEEPIPAVFPPSAAGTGVTAADLAELRQGVVERVAGDLARELTDRLAARIEQVVWEVVPDLAEILITREIERIRQAAEEPKSS